MGLGCLATLMLGKDVEQLELSDIMGIILEYKIIQSLWENN